VRRYGFIEKVLEVAGDYPQFWQGFAEGEEALRVRVNEIDVLRNLVVWFRYASRVTGDLLLLAGDDAFRIAGSYYASARDGAKRKNTEAQKVYEMLRLLWLRRRRHETSSPEEPTLPEIERDFHGVLHGRKDGKLFIKNESPRTTGGVREVVDDVR